MKRMMPNKIIAVDTNFGTNFLISACDNATVFELRGLIQMGHLSCFPEHGSIKVLALTVQYKQRQYHVTDSLLIGQICRKSWSNIHAEVSSGSLRASTSHSSKFAEAKSLANGKAGNEWVALDNTLVAKCIESKGFCVDRQSNEALVHSSSPVLYAETFSKACNEMFPIISKSQTSWLDHRCPLLSMEAPYTQSQSQLNLATRAALSKEILGKGGECKKRKCAEEEGLLGKKQNQGQNIHNFEEDKDSSPGKKSAISVKGEVNTKDQEGFLSKDQQCKQNTLCRHGFSEDVAPMKGDLQLAEVHKELAQAPIKGDRGAQVVEAHMEPKINELQSDKIFSANTCRADHNSLRKQNKVPLCPHSEAFVVSPTNLKPTSSSSEKDSATLEKEAPNQALNKARIEGGLSYPKIFTEIQAEGMEDANLNIGERVSKMDLSMSYPIQLNNHTTLFVASLSADVVPETQESQMQSQDRMNVEGEEVALAKRGLDVYKHAAMEPHSNCQDPMACEGLLPHQDTRNINLMDAHNNEENLPILAERKETSNSKPSIVVVAEKNDVNTLGAHTDELDRQLHDTGLSGGNHNVSLIQKKKKRKRKKVTGIHQVSAQEDGRFIVSGRDMLGGMEPKKDAALFLKNPTEMCNHEKGGERVCMLEGQAQTASGNMDALNVDDVHLKELESQNGTTLSVDQGNDRELFCFANERSGEKLIQGSLNGENCEAIMQGEMLGIKEGQVTQVGITRRKKKKRRKERPLPSSEGDNRLNMGNEGVGAPFSIKELPNVLGLTAVKEGGELCGNSIAKVVVEQVIKEGKKKEMIKPDPNISLMQEQGQDNAIIDHADRKALLKDRRLVATSSASSHSKECSQEGPLVKTQRGCDVFDFESSETGNRMNEKCKDNDVTSISEPNNLEKLCAAAVKLVEDEIISPSKMTMRKSSRKAVHPKRWITVLADRLTWNQTSKSNLKKQRANKRSKPVAEGAGLPINEELNSEPRYVEEEEAKEESSQIIAGDKRVACPNGCGRLYTKKTSAYYRHSRMCSGGD